LRAFLWTSAGGMRDLNDMLDASGSGWTIREAYGINNSGQIVGEVLNANGDQHAFLLTPVSQRPLLAFTEFNEPAIGANTYTPGGTGEELGFQTVTSATGGVSPLAGVATVGEGGGQRAFSHRSINATTTFDAVDLTASNDIVVSMRLQVANTTYEVGDFVRAYVTNGTDTIDLANLTAAAGADAIDDLAGDGFLFRTAVIPNDWTQATLVITSSSNSTQAAERYDFDSIEFRAIPEPSAWGLAMAAVIAAAAGRIRHRHQQARRAERK
jgi:probable HAF family extracellular repeat protein